MKVEWRTCLRVGASIFILYLAIHYWRNVSGFLLTLFSAAVPLLVGGIIAYVVNILMTFYENLYFNKSKNKLLIKSRPLVCMLAAFLTLIGIITLVITMIVPQLIDCIQVVIKGVPPVLEFWIEKIDHIEWVPEDIIDAISFQDLESRIVQMVEIFISGIGGAMGFLFTALSSAFSSIATFFIGLIFSIYLLLGKDRLQGQCRRMFKTYLKESWYEKIQNILHVFNDCFHRYIVGQCLEAVILGSFCTIGMLILRLPYATMIGALIAVTALIPIAGAYIGAAVGAFMILTVSPLEALIFLIFLVILQQLEGNLIYPKVVGSSIGLPGIWVLAAVTVGGSLMGVLGMMLAVPLVAALYRLLREDMNRRSRKIEKKQDMEKQEKAKQEEIEQKEAKSEKVRQEDVRQEKAE